MKILILLFFLISMTSCVTKRIEISQLQGAWWSDQNNPTADFGINGDKVWLDYDSEYHPCRIEGDILIFDLGKDYGLVKNRIVKLEGDKLVLEHLDTKTTRTLFREK